MPREPLAVLALLRGRERDAARQAMATARTRQDVAEAGQRAVAESFMSEAATAAPADYAAWLPAAHLARARAVEASHRAGAAVEDARATLVTARAAAEALVSLIESRRRARRRARLAAEQRLLDDLPR